jgi:hypothetical protein
VFGVLVLSGPQFANKLDQLLEQVDSNQTQLCATDHIEVRPAHTVHTVQPTGMQSILRPHGLVTVKLGRCSSNKADARQAQLHEHLCASARQGWLSGGNGGS